MENLFSKGQKVQVVKKDQNASDFTSNHNGLHCRGVYGDDSWRLHIYHIEGTVQLITFMHTTNIYAAYLLTHHGRPVGYVYNTALKAL